MPLYILRNGANWTLSPDGRGATGDAVGFDTDTGRPLWRHPVSGHWVDGTGEVFSPSGTGYAQFYSTTNSGLLAAM